jgi:hypothetical protein
MDFHRMPTFQTLGSSVEKSFADLLDGLDQASTPDEVWNVGSKWMMAFGVEWYHYVYTRERWEPGGRQLVRYSSMPQSSMEHYGARASFVLTLPFATASSQLPQCSLASLPPVALTGQRVGCGTTRRAQVSVAASLSPFGSLDPR